MSSTSSSCSLSQNESTPVCPQCGGEAEYSYILCEQCCIENDIDQRETTVLEAHLMTEGFFKTPLLMSQRPTINSKYVTLGFILLLFILISGGLAGFLFTQKSAASNSSLVAENTTYHELLFTDDFQNNQHQWHLEQEQDVYDIKITDGSLILENKRNQLLSALLPNNHTYDNFKLVVDATLSNGDAKNGYGLYIRSSTDQHGGLATYYRFELYGDGTYAIFKGVLDKNGQPQAQPISLVHYTAHQAIKPRGQSNTITIIANNSLITFMVNGQTLRTLVDRAYTSGFIALFVSNVENIQPGAEARFEHLSIYKLDPSDK